MQLNANSPKFLLAVLILAGLSLVYTITATVPANHAPTLSAVAPRTQIAQVSGSSCTTGDLTCGLVGWWKLDDGSGTTASDSSGSGNTGTIQGNANWVSGAIGGAFSFDGATSMNIGTASSLDFTNAFTFSFWIKTGSVGTNQTIFTRGLPFSIPGKEQYDIILDQYSDPGTIAFRYGNSTTIGGIETAYHSIPTGVWTHVAATYDGSQACLYVNGTQNVCKPFVGPLVDVGQAPVMGLSRTWYLNAAIDDFRAYDRALSASDIQALYALGSGASSGTSQTSVSATPTPTPTPTSVTTTTTSGSGTTQTTGSGTSPATVSGSIYVSQSGTGSGSSCADSRSLAWLNTASNWAASGAGLVTPGTTVHICGTLTDTLHVRGSGAPGNPVTIHFEPNAAMSAPIWPSSWLGSNGAIIAMSVHDIVLDGGQNGLIEATQSGTGLQPASVGILMSAVSDVEVKGFTIRNMYVRTSSTDVAASGYGIALLGASTNVSLHDNRIYQMNTGIQLMYPEGALMSHIRMYRNTISDTNWCIGIGEQNVNALADDIQVYGNDLSGSGTEWDSPTDTYHHNGVHTFAVATGDSVTGLKIFDNYVHGDFGVDVTAMLFSEGAIVGAEYYNNILVNTGSPGLSNGFIAATGKIYNNTFIDHGTSMAIDTTNASDIENNIMYNTRTGVAIHEPVSSTTISDHNIFYAPSGAQSMVTFGVGGVGHFYTLASWRSSFGLDLDSATSDPRLVDPVVIGGDYHLMAGSPALGYGQNLSTYFNTDFSGIARPASGGWDLGAYQYSTTVYPLPVSSGTAQSSGNSAASGGSSPVSSGSSSGSNNTGMNVAANTAGTTGGGGGGGIIGGSASITTGTNSGASNSAANSPTAPCTASPSAIPASALSLTIGTRGPEVTNLQTFLAIMGYLNRIYITGYFGPLTKAALTSYQLAHPSSCSNTQAPSNNNQTSSNNQISPFARSLKLGMIGNDVKNLQIFLNQHNFTVSQSGAGSSGKETTYFGPATFRALIRFQNAYANQILAPYGLSQGTGFFGPSSIKEANSLI